MLDIKRIKDDPEAVKAGLRAKEVDCDAAVDRILELDAQRRALILSTETDKAEQNRVSKEIPKRKKAGEDVAPIFARMAELKAQIAQNDQKLTDVEAEYRTLMLSLPNLPDPDLKPGGKENNEPLRYYGEPHHFDFEPKHHVDLCTDLGLIDYERGTRLAGSGFWIYRGMGARLEWALLNYFIDEHLKDGYAQAIVVNSGNANTCAPNGVQLAKDTCDIVAKELGIRADDVLPSSTGVIGQAMSIEPFAKGIPEAAAKLAADEAGSHDAATAIMTTDTHPKEIALEFAVGGQAVRIGAIAKGSGMIHPNMATMLLFMTTDAKVAPAALQKALSTVVPATFNQISVDGDTSTNDTVLLLASGLSGAEIAEGTPDYDTFVAALTEVAEHLSRELAGDGEGATKLLECTVTGAPDLATARAVSKSVIHSTLFKAAMFGADANWGRVLCAIGYTPGDFDISKTSVRLKSKAGEVFVCENAAYHPYSEDEATVVLKEDEIDILVDLGSGDATAKAWGCDLTYDYVKINGDYRT